jgi:hypothetical protein
MVLCVKAMQDGIYPTMTGTETNNYWNAVYDESVIPYLAVPWAKSDSGGVDKQWLKTSDPYGGFTVGARTVSTNRNVINVHVDLFKGQTSPVSKDANLGWCGFAVTLDAGVPLPRFARWVPTTSPRSSTAFAFNDVAGATTFTVHFSAPDEYFFRWGSYAGVDTAADDSQWRSAYSRWADVPNNITISGRINI